MVPWITIVYIKLHLQNFLVGSKHVLKIIVMDMLRNFRPGIAEGRLV